MSDKDTHSAHLETALYKEASFQLAEPFCLSGLCVETLQLWLHIFMCEGYASI